MLGPIQRRPGKHFKSGAKKSGSFENDIKGSGWENLAQQRLIARICVLFRA